MHLKVSTKSLEYFGNHIYIFLDLFGNEMYCVAIANRVFLLYNAASLVCVVTIANTEILPLGGGKVW